MQFIKSLVVFALAVVRQTAAYMTGGVVAAGVTTYEHYKGKSISMNAFTWGVVAFFVVACFLTWKKEHDRGGRTNKAEALNEVFERTRKIRDMALTTNEDYQAWKRSVDEHPKWIQQTLRGKISGPEINILLNGPAGPRLGFRDRFGDEQNRYNNYLHYLEHRISSLIEKYA